MNLGGSDGSMSAKRAKHLDDSLGFTSHSDPSGIGYKTLCVDLGGMVRINFVNPATASD